MSRPLKVHLIILLSFACCLCTCTATTKQGDNHSAGPYPPAAFLSPISNIPISLEEKQLVTIRMFDLLGNEIAVFFQDTLEAGFHVYVVEPDTSLPRGEYLIECQTRDSTYQQKYIHLKQGSENVRSPDAPQTGLYGRRGTGFLTYRSSSGKRKIK